MDGWMDGLTKDNQRREKKRNMEPKVNKERNKRGKKHEKER